MDLLNIITLIMVCFLIIILIRYREQKRKLELDISLRDRIEDKLNMQRNNEQLRYDSFGVSPINSVTGTVLLLDDQKSITFMIKQLLDKSGFTTIVFNDPMEAVEYFKLNHDEIDIIITDYSVPGMEGTDIIRQFKDIKNVPLIVFTGHSYIAFENEKELGMVDGVLYKPTSPINVINKVIELLQKPSKDTFI